MLRCPGHREERLTFDSLKALRRALGVKPHYKAAQLARAPTVPVEYNDRTYNATLTLIDETPPHDAGTAFRVVSLRNRQCRGDGLPPGAAISESSSNVALLRGAFAGGLR